MNCQDIERILDEDDVTRLDAEVGAAVDIHLRGCPQCARDWQLHLRLARKVLPVMPAGMRARCRELAAQESRPGAARVRRLVVVGAVALAAAAALWLGWRKPAVVVPVAAATAPVQEPTQEPQSPAPGVTAGPPDSRIPDDPPPAGPPAGSFSVWVLPPQAGSEDAAIRSAARQLHESIVEALRNIPGANVREGESAAGRRADYILRLSNHTISTTDPEGMWRFQVSVQVPLSTLSPEQVKAYGEVRAAQGMAAASVDGYMQRFTFGSLVSLDLPCRMCPAKQAVDAVNSIRLNAFRLDLALQRETHARFLDSGTDFATRQKLLRDLNTLAGTGRATAVDAQFIRAILDMHATASDTTQRLSLWSSLGNYTDTAMIEPMVRLVRQETDTQVRAMLVSQLVKNFRSDDMARKALEEIATADASDLLRHLARRATEGNEAWHQYLSSTLQDQNLSSLQRWEPVDYLLRATTAGELGMTQQSLARLDSAAIAALAEVLPDVWGEAPPKGESDPGRVGQDLARLTRLQNLFGQLKDPALARLLLESLDGGSPFSRSGIVTMLQKYVDEPEVAEALEAIRDGDADVKVREAAVRSLARRKVPTG